MHSANHAGILNRRLIVPTLAAVLAGCGGSGGTASPGDSSSTSNSGAGGGTGTPAVSTVLFQQPQEDGIGGHFFVPLAPQGTRPKGEFSLVLWQVDPFTSNGELVPTSWDAGSETGFTPSTTLNTELGFQDKPGTTTAQMSGDVVGAYLNSQDLPSSPVGQKMMITPEYIFVSGSEPVPFASSTAVLSSSMDVQIPVAVGSDTYVNVDFLFVDPNGTHVSYGIKLFHNGVANPTVSTGYDPPTNGYIIDPPLGSDQRFVSVASGSALSTGTPWTGWQHFEWSISQSQFAAALNYLAAAFPAAAISADPTHYVLTELHLNAEFHFQPDPAELGWSMRGWTVSSTTPGG